MGSQWLLWSLWFHLTLWCPLSFHSSLSLSVSPSLAHKQPQTKIVDRYTHTHLCMKASMSRVSRALNNLKWNSLSSRMLMCNFQSINSICWPQGESEGSIWVCQGVKTYISTDPLPIFSPSLRDKTLHKWFISSLSVVWRMLPLHLFWSSELKCLSKRQGCDIMNHTNRDNNKHFWTSSEAQLWQFDLITFVAT